MFDHTKLQNLTQAVVNKQLVEQKLNKLLKSECPGSQTMSCKLITLSFTTKGF